MVEQEEKISCIFPHSDMEFGVTNGDDWTKEYEVSFNRSALRGYLSDILPKRSHPYYYGIHYEMTEENKDKVETTWKNHGMLFPIPNHKLTKDSRVYFFYKWEIVGDALVDKIIYNEHNSEFSQEWDPKVYPIIVKFQKDSIRIFPHDSISKEVMEKVLTEKTMKTLPMGYPILTNEEEKNLQDEIVKAVRNYSSKFIYTP